MTAREEIGRLQRRLFQRQQKLIEGSVHASTAAFRAYEGRYRERTRGFLREARYHELLAQIASSDRVYVGDYHTLKQAQRSFLKLVQRRQGPRPLVLALEFVQGRHQAALDGYLSGKLSRARFLERIEYKRHQLFDVWPNFEPIFDEARTRKLRVLALDLLGGARTTLRERDEYAARRIAQTAARTPEAQIFVLAGQLHVAPPHLPAAVDRRLRLGKKHAQGRSLTIYQNCESIYWELQRSGRELEVETTLVRTGEWCLINTPPVVVQQSFLDWIEGGERPMESGHPEARFRELASLVARFLGLHSKALTEALEQVSVYTAGDLSFVDSLPERGFSATEIKQIERQILSRESYYIPRAKIAYLANLSVNHAAEEAAHFVRSVVSGGEGEPRGLVDAFYARALEEAYAFCGSKIVNPRRKCPHQPEFEKLARGRPGFTREVARFVLDHQRIERGERSQGALGKLYRSGGADLFNAVTHSLGYMLGERLYYALATGRMLKSEVRMLFLDPLEDDGVPFLTYLDLATRLADVRIPKRL